MPPNFRDLLSSIAERYPGPMDSSSAREEVTAFIEREVETFDLGSLRIRFGDLDDVAPEAAGLDESHPAFQAAVEEALFVAIRDAGHLVEAPALAAP